MPAPVWLALLSPLPHEAVPSRQPVASAEQIANGTAGPIDGWQSVTVNLSAPSHGLRHVQITLDASGQLLAASDHVMFIRETTPDGAEVLLSDHESLGGRFEADESFRGTHWFSTIEGSVDGDDGKNVTRRADHRPPTDDEIAALRRIIADVLALG